MKIQFPPGKNAIFFLLVIISMAAMIAFGLNSGIDYSPINTDGITFVTGKTVDIVSEEVETDDMGQYRGRQDLKVELLSGGRKGDVIDVANFLSYNHNVYVRRGQRIIVYLDQQPGDDYYYATVQSYERSPAIVAIIALMFALLAAVGGKTGVRSAFGLIFTFVVIFSLLIPLILQGAPPVPLSLALILCVIFVSLISILGFTKKACVSILGTGAGVVICCVFFLLLSRFLRITGYNVPEMESLIVIAYNTNIQIGGFLFAGILFASLGAVMDVSVSVASSVAEISESGGRPPFEALFRSGIKISRDIVGATLNTLIMAFAGASLITLIIFRIYNYDITLLINHNDIAIEILQAVASSSALILCAPITSYIAARFYCAPAGKP